MKEIKEKINYFTLDLILDHKLTSTTDFTTYQIDRILKKIYPDLKGRAHRLITSRIASPEENIPFDKPEADEIYANEFCTVRYWHATGTYSETINWSGLLNLIQYFGSKYPTEYDDLLKISRYYRNNYLSVIQVEKLISELTGNNGYSAVYGYDLIARPIYWKLVNLNILPFAFDNMDNETVLDIENSWIRVDINIPFRFEITWLGFFLILKHFIYAGLICQKTNGSEDESILLNKNFN